MAITKKVTITLTPEMHDKAKSLAKTTYRLENLSARKQNLSGLIQQLLEKELKEHPELK